MGSLPPPGLSLSPAPDIPVVRVSSCRRAIFCPDPPSPLLSHPPTAVETSSHLQSNPQNSPQGVAGGPVGGCVGCGPQQGPQESCAPLCPAITPAEGTADHKSTSPAGASACSASQQRRGGCGDGASSHAPAVAPRRKVE